MNSAPNFASDRVNFLINHKAMYSELSKNGVIKELIWRKDKFKIELVVDYKEADVCLIFSMITNSYGNVRSILFLHYDLLKTPNCLNLDISYSYSWLPESINPKNKNTDRFRAKTEVIEYMISEYPGFIEWFLWNQL